MPCFFTKSAWLPCSATYTAVTGKSSVHLNVEWPLACNTSLLHTMRYATLLHGAANSYERELVARQLVCWLTQDKRSKVCLGVTTNLALVQHHNCVSIAYS
eukprot:GHUV01033429.1.p1 GENE.GHUV01033429.1~~GHUV01033429.1.p1  ORF type:complete len:101 (-),score=4.43 GHUV01033429.1:190-492(-)